jgi:DNA-binding transcriptional MocR family regulator
MLKYRSLYERYRGLLVAGAYAPGERLPSLRSVAESSGLGLNTVRSAFELLESDGLVESLERGGYFARGRPARGAALGPYVGPRSCRETGGLSAAQKIEYLLAAGGAAAGFALAEPDASLYPVARLERIAASLSGSWIEYGDPAGEAELRRRIAATYRACHGALEPDEIMVTNGATEALGIALRALLEPGDVVAVESPTYYDYFRQLSAARARIVEVPMARGGGMDLDLLEAALAGRSSSKSRAIRMIIAQPNVQNPMGTVMPDDDKRRLLALAARYGAFLVQDDAYGDLAYGDFPSGGGRPVNLSSFGDYERLVYLSSFSKCLAPGLRIGWMRAPGLMTELSRAKSLASLATNRPGQRVIASYLAGSAFRKQLAAMRRALASQLEDYLDILSGGLPEGSSIARPQGGCLLWIGLPKGRDGSRLFEEAAREGILVAPGELFSANPFFRNHVRVNFGHRLGERRRVELERLCAIARGIA